MKDICYKRKDKNTLLKIITTTIDIPISVLKEDIRAIDIQISRTKASMAEDFEWIRSDRLKIKKLQKEKEKIMKLINKK